MAIKVLIVDDSAFLRVTLTKLLKCNEIEICGTARDGIDALNKIKLFNPDVITLDVEMPNMNGIECLNEILKRNIKIPVIMCSSITTEGAETTLKAMELGAVDFIAKPSKKELDDYEKLKFILKNKILTAARINLNKYTDIISEPEKKITVSQPKFVTKTSSKKFDICLIGTSTGGPVALQKVITKLPADLSVGIVVVQHMPVGFTASLANRLNDLSEIKVKESENGDIVEPGLVIIGKAGNQLAFVKRGEKIQIRHIAPEKTDLFKPSVNYMIESASKVYENDRMLNVIMTGMGDDGLKSIKSIKKNNPHIIVESKDTAVVFGMPGVLVKENLADEILPIWNIGDRITDLLK